MSETLGTLLVGLLCIGIIFLVIIGVVTLLSVNRKRSRKMTAVPSNWRAIPGRVTVASVEETVRTRVDDDVFYYPSIEFGYTLEGQAYSGKQAIGKPSNFELKAKRALAHYQPGVEITVAYNPDKPDEARLLMK
jgi:hypothetical protein